MNSFDYGFSFSLFFSKTGTFAQKNTVDLTCQ